MSLPKTLGGMVNRRTMGMCPFCAKEMSNPVFRDELSAKEFRISGLCQECQDKTFDPTEDHDETQVEYLTPPEPQCNGICMTGYDVGVPHSGIAYAHPECPVHGGK